MNRKCLVVWAMCGVLVCGMTFAEEAPCADQLHEQLKQSFSITMEDTHLESIVATITDEFGIEVIVDNRVVRPLDEVKINVDAEYVTDGQLPYVNLENVQLGTGLRTILRPLGLDYGYWGNNVLWISTPERIRHETFEDLETRFYTLNSQYVEDVNATRRSDPSDQIDLVALLRLVTPDVVDTDSGEVVSLIHFNSETNQLLVHTTLTHHKRIEQLLKLVKSS